ncbi:hypothetical protein C8R45DRAFT_1179170 [Mycena sanguinolenta]|nr:hypothetical protein C8R45DRAFT_1179170 [Mycena sanguinolenta]
MSLNWFPESFPWLQPIKCPQITTFNILRPSDPTTSLHSFKFSPIMVHVPFVFQTLIISLGPLITSARPLQSRGMGVARYKPSRYMSDLPQNTRVRGVWLTSRSTPKPASSPRTKSPTPQQHWAAMLNSDVQKQLRAIRRFLPMQTVSWEHSWTNLGQHCDVDMTYINSLSTA